MTVGPYPSPKPLQPLPPRRKPAPAPRRPTHFPDENLAERWEARHLLGHTEFEEFRFLGCRLAGANFRTATCFVIDPERNPLAGAHFTLAGLLGVVARYNLVVE